MNINVLGRFSLAQDLKYCLVGDGHCVQHVSNLDSIRNLVCYIPYMNNKTRCNLYKKAKQNGAIITSYVSSKSTVCDNVELGDGTIIFPNCYVGSNVRIGSNCIIMPNCVISHDCVIEDNCYIAPSVTLGGFVQVGVNSTLYLSSSVIPSTVIGSDVTVGMGAVVINNCANDHTYVGNPATPIRKG